MRNSRKKRVTAMALWTFAVLNSIIWALLSAQYFTDLNPPVSTVGSVFSVTYALGHFFSAGLVFFLLLLVLRFFTGRYTVLAAVAFAVVLTGLLAADLKVFSLFRMHITPSLVGIFFAGSPFEIYDPPASFYFKIALGILLIIVIQRLFLFVATRPFIQKCAARIAVLLVLAFLAFNCIHAVAAHKSFSPVLVRASALPYSFPLTARSLLSSLGMPEAASHEWAEDLSGLGLDYPKGDLTFAPVEQKLNILVLLLDSWRVDSFSADIMPLLHERARKNALVFTNHFSGGNSTRTGVFSLFYGVPSPYFHSFYASRIGPVLVDALRANNYDFGLYCATGFEGVDLGRTVFANFPNLPKVGQGSTNAERDSNMERDLLAYLARQDGSTPFFAFAFYDLLHGHIPFPDLPHPFQPSAGWDYLSLDRDASVEEHRNTYYNAAYTLDIHLDGVFQLLEEKGLLDSTLVIVTGDHADEINDAGYWGHNGTFTRYQTQTPMMLFWPGKAAQRITYRTRHYDLAPTLMEELLGFSGDSLIYSQGLNMLDNSEREFTLMASYLDNAIVYGDNVYVMKKYGVLETYTLDGKPATAPLPPDVLSRALQSLRYYLHE